MNTLTTTSMEMESLAQQYKVPVVMTPERTVLCPDLYVLTNDVHWTGSFCSVTTENRRTTRYLQLDYYAVCVRRSLCLDDVTNDSSSTQVEVPKGVDRQTRDMLERCMATCGKTQTRRDDALSVGQPDKRLSMNPQQNTNHKPQGLTHNL